LPTDVRKTPLFDAHVAAGGRMVDFSGWHLPVQYSGLIDEHRAVRNAVGMFDVSHMGEARVRGPQALEFLQWVTCNDVARLRDGRAHYTGLMTEDGTFVDDLLIYRLAATEYLLVLNAANTQKDVAHLRAYLSDFDCEVIDESADWCQIAVQGPASQQVCEAACGIELAALRYYRFLNHDIQDASCIISRTGYTGEDGFEIYAPAALATSIWDGCLAAGHEHGIQPAGLGARDTLRLEAAMALYGHEIDDTTTPYQANLGWIVKPAKGEFLGSRRLADEKRRLDAGQPLERRLVGLEMSGRAIARQGYPVLDAAGERTIGIVTSGSPAPALGSNIALAHVTDDGLSTGHDVKIGVRKRVESATIVETPFYKRER